MAKPFPVGGGMTSFWRSQPDVLDNNRSTETLPESSDIVIIGAGYTGAATAYHCIEQSQSTGKEKPSIVILEARQACSGATGRNGGHLKPDVYNGTSTLANDHGIEAAAEVAAFEMQNLQAVQSFVEKEKVECDLRVAHAIDVQLDDAHCAKLNAGLESLVANGLEASKLVEINTGEKAEAFSGVKGARGCFSYGAGRLWPYKLIMHLLKRAIASRANLQTYTPVLQVSDTPDKDGRWAVTTNRGSIRAKKVVYACNAYTSALAPEFQNHIIPVRGICSRIVVPNPPRKPLDSSYTLRFNNWDYDYLIPRPDGSIVVGGARSMYLSEPGNWYNVTDDSRLVESAAQYFDGYMQRHFHGWENTGAYTDRVWTGIMGYTTDFLPHIGPVPGKPEQTVIAGFNGHGMPQIFLSALGVARMIVEGTEYGNTGLPRLFEATLERLQSKENRILHGIPSISDRGTSRL
ncbi:NAD(P)/FAD-dependent oxidoreductase [Aspergillus glaucus CBS 516.65]|uniref:FAD dependent oxidoreductase domain-containing protein n=1 Tax=Aspergillus glaucus CBS 516.65 TaxID=1160497 RepID=A0A1L9VEG4_ASPGL|nr:hypothetical protein ASPGLDRAFT_130581 [Aspergillus glaucus CBS 516.65]OJJ82338.1 hypothetical protein ASPGLDRAFT_130581 [Aspergillus glaucus CBS 516.65]